MKIAPSKLDLPYFFRKRLLGRISLSREMEVAKPESIPERTGRLREDILRWADDGGQMLDLGTPIGLSDSDLALAQANEE